MPAPALSTLHRSIVILSNAKDPAPARTIRAACRRSQRNVPRIVRMPIRTIDRVRCWRSFTSFRNTELGICAKRQAESEAGTFQTSNAKPHFPKMSSRRSQQIGERRSVGAWRVIFRTEATLPPQPNRFERNQGDKLQVREPARSSEENLAWFPPNSPQHRCLQRRTRMSDAAAGWNCSASPSSLSFSN